jgi:hypothetical protein
MHSFLTRQSKLRIVFLVLATGAIVACTDNTVDPLPDPHGSVAADGAADASGGETGSDAESGDTGVDAPSDAHVNVPDASDARADG